MKLILVLALIIFSTLTQAKNLDGERLVQGCNELVGIYKNNKEKRLLAFQMISVSDAILAGYCKGVIQSFKQLANPRVYYEEVQCGYGVRGPCHKLKEVYACEHSDWFEIAEAIVLHWTVKETNDSVREILNEVCGA